MCETGPELHRKVYGSKGGPGWELNKVLKGLLHTFTILLPGERL